MRTSDTEPAFAPVIGARARGGVVKLTLRTIAVRAVTLVGTVIVVRLLEPADYGLFAIVLALMSFVGPLAELGLGAALIQQRPEPTRAQVNAVWTVQAVLSLVLLAAAWLFAPLIGSALDLPAGSAELLILAAMAVLLSHLQSVPGALLARQLRFGVLGIAEIAGQGAYFATSIALALNGAGAFSLVMGLVAQYLIAGMILYAAAPIRPAPGSELTRVRGLLPFGIHALLINYLGVGRDALVPVFGGVAGGVPAVGQLQVGQRLGRLLGGLDEIAAQVGLPVFSRLREDPHRVSTAVREAFESLALVLAAPVCWSVAVAPALVPTVLGDQWRPAVPVFQLVAAGALLNAPAQVLRAVVIASGGIDAVTRWTLLTLLVTAGLFPLLLVALGLVGGGVALLLYAAILFAGYARMAARRVALSLGRLVVPYVLGSIAAGSGLAVLSLGSGPGALLLSAIATALAYGALVLAFERQTVVRLLRGYRSLLGR